MTKLIWINSEYLREMGGDRFELHAKNALTRAGFDLSTFSPKYIHDALDTCQGKVKKFSELPAYAGFYFHDDVRIDAAAAAKDFTPENKPRVEKLREAFAALNDFNAAILETTLKSVATELGVKAGVLVHPTRLATTGGSAGPSLYHLLEILGRERVLQRLDRALAL